MARLIGRASSVACAVGRELIVVGVLILGAGCLHDDGLSDRASTTSLTVGSIHLGSRTPPLPSFVTRIAQSELPLNGSQLRTVSELATDADEATRPIDEARVVFLEVLARSVEEGQLRTSGTSVAADRVVRATEQAAPELVTILEELHRTLNPTQRKILVPIVKAKFDAWAPSWDVTRPRPRSLETAGHGWITTFANDDIRALGPVVERDMTTLAREWTTQVIKRVETDLTTLDAPGKRRLIIRLRTDSWTE